MKVRKARDITKDNLKVLLYGKSGTGKTRCLGTLPKPCFVYSFDPGGMLTLRGEDVDYGYFVDGETPAPFKDFENHLQTFMRDGADYKSVAVDSATMLTEICMDHIIKCAKRTPPPQQHDYLVCMSMLTQITKLFLSMKKDVVFICHEELVKDELTGGVQGLPLLTGKLRHRLPLMFDECYRTQTRKQGKETKWLWQTQADATYVAKSRLSIENLTEQDFQTLKGE